MPEDLMGTILGESPRDPDAERDSPRSRVADRAAGSPSTGGEGNISWEEYPERVGITFNLSKQVNIELDRLRAELELEGDVRPSKSEVAEVALRIAVEDARERGTESGLIQRLISRHAVQATGTTDEHGLTRQRSVDDAGFIVETTYDESGEIVDEDVIASVAELPVETEYMDEKGRLVSLAKDELGNTFEHVMDNAFNTLGIRLLPSAN